MKSDSVSSEMANHNQIIGTNSMDMFLKEIDGMIIQQQTWSLPMNKHVSSEYCTGLMEQAPSDKKK